MQDTNIHTGVYEQIINRLFKLKLNEVDAGRFYIGKKLIRSRHSPTFRTEGIKSRSSLSSAVILDLTICIIQYRTTQLFSKESGSTSNRI